MLRREEPKKKKKKKVQPSTETPFRNSLGGFEDVQLSQFKAVPGSCPCSFVTLHKSHHYPTQRIVLTSSEYSAVYIEDLFGTSSKAAAQDYFDDKSK